MVTGAHSDAQAVEQRAHIQVVDIAHLETYHGIVMLCVCRAKDVHTPHLRHLFHSVAGKITLVSLYLLHSQGIDIVDSPRQTSGCHIVGRACLEFVGKFIEGCMLEADVLDHLASAHVRGHAVKPFLLAIEHSYARGAIHLVPAEGVEITVHQAHVDGHVRCALCTIHQHRHIMGMCHAYDVGHGIDRTQHIAHVSNAHQTRAAAEDLLQSLERESAVVAHGYHADAYAQPLLQELPGNDVAVMLHLAHYHLVALAHERLAETTGHQIDALCGAAGEEYLAGAACAYEAAHSLACLLVQVGGLLREEVHATVHIGIHIIIFVHHRLHHEAWLLGGGGIVKIYKRILVIHLPAQNGEVGAYLLYVKRSYWHNLHPSHFDNSPRRRLSTCTCRRSRSVSCGMASITSVIKADLSSRRASCSEMPR